MKDPKGAAERLKLRAITRLCGYGKMDSDTLRDIATLISDNDRLRAENVELLELAHSELD